MAKKTRKFVMIYFSHKDKFKLLGFENLGKLIWAAMEYAENGIIPDFSDNVLLEYAWTEIKEDVDISINEYEKRVGASSNGGKSKALKDTMDISPDELKLIKQLGAKGEDVYEYVNKIKEELSEKGLTITGKDFVEYACGNKEGVLAKYV